MVDDGDTEVSIPMLLTLLLLLLMMMMTMMMVVVVVASDVLPQSLLLGATVLKPHLDHTHVEPGLGAQPLAHLSCGLGAVVVGALQRIQLLAADRRSWSLATAAKRPTAVVSFWTAICTQFAHPVPVRC